MPALLGIAACGEEPAARWPSRNYTGTYVARASVAEDDCRAPTFARGDTLLLDVAHAYDNAAVVGISPVVRVRGRFEGDRLDASSAVALPPAAAAAASPGDSLRYEVTLAFEGDRVQGTYEVRQPAMAGLERCRQVFELEGSQVQRRPTAILPAPAAP